MLFLYLKSRYWFCENLGKYLNYIVIEMKKWQILLGVALLAIFQSCSRDDEETLLEVPSNSDTVVVEGCVITNPDTALVSGVFKADYIYIYGARRTEDNRYKLWIAQYTQNHELVKEYEEVYKTLPLYVIKMTPLPNKQYLLTVNCGTPDDRFNVAEQLPVIFSPEEQLLKVIRIQERFYFDQIRMFKDCMFLYLSEAQSTLIEDASLLKVQIDYQGKVLSQFVHMRIPKDTDSLLWINSSEYIAANSFSVTYTSLDEREDTKWQVKTGLYNNERVDRIAYKDNRVCITYTDTLNSESVPKILYFDMASGRNEERAQQITITSANDSLVVAKNTALQIQAKIYPETVFLKGIHYKSSDESVATVTQNGEVRMHKNGNCIIRINSEDGFAKKEVKLVVASLSFEYAEERAVIGTPKFLELIVDDWVVKDELLWKSSDTSVASVDEKGIVMGLKKGQTRISVTTSDGTLQSECLLSVNEFVDYVSAKTSMTFIGSSAMGVMSLELTINNVSGYVGQISEVYLMYDTLADSVCLYNQVFPLDEMLSLTFPSTVIYPISKPYILIKVEYDGITYEKRVELNLLYN